MNDLKSKFGDNLEVLGFPCNQFGHQTNEGEAELLNTLKYVRPGNGFEPAFHVFSKVDVNGENAHPLFAWMRSQQPIPTCPKDGNVLTTARAAFGNQTYVLWSPICRDDVAWNFEKFLFDKNGNFVRRYSRHFKTEDIASDIEKL